jgi:hypothetical protein
MLTRTLAPSGAANSGVDANGPPEQDTPQRLHDLVAALRRYDARMKGLACLAPTRVSCASAGYASHAPKLSDWHWHREVMLPTSLGKLPAPLLEDPAVRLAFAESSLMTAGLVARALYARRSAVRRCIDRTVLMQLRVALGDGFLGHERLQRLQRLTAADGDLPLPLPEVLTTTSLAHDGLARLRRAHPMMVPVVVHFVLMQLDRAPSHVAEDADNARSIGKAGQAAAIDADCESAVFFERLPYLIPELI